MFAVKLQTPQKLCGQIERDDRSRGNGRVPFVRRLQ